MRCREPTASQDHIPIQRKLFSVDIPNTVNPRIGQQHDYKDMSGIKPIKVWGKAGVNPPKVVMILEELSLPYEVVEYPIADVKKPEYLAINPNGRLPAIQDPNSDLTLWESGAIVEYLVEKYDKQHLISFEPGSTEQYHAKQWLYFQVSGQGPYFGQAAWFAKFHPEQLPSAKERYNNEVKRVSGVLDEWLGQQKQKYAETGGDGPWLVGNRCSFADISFIMWDLVIGMILPKEEYDTSKFPHLADWYGRMASRKAIKPVVSAAGPSK